MTHQRRVNRRSCEEAEVVARATTSRHSCLRNHFEGRSGVARDEARRAAPHHDDHRRRAEERRVLRRPARPAPGQEDGQLRPAGGVPPLLRRRDRRARLDPDLVRVRRRPARPRRPRDGPHAPARRPLRRRDRLLGAAPGQRRLRVAAHRARHAGVRGLRRPRPRAGRERRRQPAADRRLTRRSRPSTRSSGSRARGPTASSPTSRRASSPTSSASTTRATASTSSRARSATSTGPTTRRRRSASPARAPSTTSPGPPRTTTT